MPGKRCRVLGEKQECIPVNYSWFISLIKSGEQTTNAQYLLSLFILLQRKNGNIEEEKNAAD